MISLLLVNCVCSHKEIGKVMLTGAWSNVTIPGVVGVECTNVIRRPESLVKGVHLKKKKN